MKNILLSTSLVLALAFSGCDNNDTKTSSPTEQLVEATITEGKTVIATLEAAGVSYTILEGDDASFFKMDGNKLLFKSAQDYLQNGDNSYRVKIKAADVANVKQERILIITVNVTRGIVINPSDTTPPVFTTGTTLNMTTGGTTTIAATDASAPITYALTSGAGFALDGSTLTAPATAGETNVTITATDAATTPNTATQTITVTVTVPSANGVVFSPVQDARFTLAAATAACTAMAPAGTWELPNFNTLNTNSADVFELVKNIDSDNNASTMPSIFNSVLWSSTPDTNASQTLGLWYKSGTAASAEELPRVPTREFYFTCVKK